MSLGMSYKPNVHQHIPGTSGNQGKGTISVKLNHSSVKSSVKFGLLENNVTWRKTVSVVFVQLYIGSDPRS